ncbi:peptidylprolyl isomerase [Mangrovibacterium marinum]|uniref:peptidylprolyl isomerase n=1 Tax=Mangrovibacterium marinum TaxID=1639118 RepID=A0A2T5BXB3_9BACT|nr:peptidylprolyl isomerase [Mangrovibacterium marinum]PTN04813.1 cyclophilin family peptidyl-prolyl cis-trans isomerase [Mangrovibacterium marinum]
MLKKYSFILLVSLLASCSSSPKKPTEQAAKETTETQAKTPFNYLDYVPAIVKLESFDHARFLESETAFFVDSNLIVSRLSPLIEANTALISPWNQDKKYEIDGFVAIDRINDLVILKTSAISRPAIPLAAQVIPIDQKTIYLTRPQGNTLPLHKGSVKKHGNIGGAMRYQLTNQFRSKSYGTPVFSGEKCIGLGYADVIEYENQNLAIPSNLIVDLLRKASTNPQPLDQLKSSTDKATSEANKRIKGLLIETDLGNIKIRLYNQTPEYRDNFIALVNENYYDSLLIHRVIKGFCIQSGAADTRYAGKNDVVGWKGPGYTLPAHIVPGLYHKRGVIGSPRKPDRGNSKRRSDGSQFYIVTGRTYSDSELDDITKETGYQFTAEQRRVYKTVGGAPHIDGTYTIFGEVSQGMDIADKINALPVDSDYRPRKDIRIRRIRILK